MEMLLTLDEQGKAAHGPGPVLCRYQILLSMSVYLQTLVLINRFLVASQILFLLCVKSLKKTDYGAIDKRNVVYTMSMGRQRPGPVLWRYQILLFMSVYLST